jgi:type II secretory pathway component PulC
LTRDARRALWWLPAAALLLAFGFLAWLGVASYLAGRSLDPAEIGRMQTAFVLYARFTLFKGLLPALALAYALWPLLERAFGLARRGGLASALGIIAASAAASTAVAALLLPSDLWGFASVVRHAGSAQLAQTCAEMTAGVAAALLVARWGLRSRAQLPVWLSGVALACIAAGFLLPRSGPAPQTANAPTGRESAPAAAPAPAPSIAPAMPPPAEPAPDYPVTSLPLALIATQVDALESRSKAMIAELADLSTATLHLGDTLENHPDTTLARIEAQRVLLDRDGQLEQLVVGGNPQQLLARLASDLGKRSWKQPKEEALAYRRAAAERLRERIDDPPAPKTVASGLLADATPVPVYDGDALVGFQLDEVRPGGVYDQVGLRDGDRIDAINGVAIGAPGARDALVAALTKSPGFSIAVARRDGKRETIAVPTEQILRALAGLDAAN